jgi:hypothetical protein
MVPVFSKPTLPHFWEHSDAKKLAATVGSHTVVANSLVVEQLQNAAGIEQQHGLGTALAQSPGSAVAHSYVDNPAGVVFLRLIPEGAVRLLVVDRDT